MKGKNIFLPFTVNGGKNRADLFELEINGEPLPGWNISFAGVLLDSEFIDRDDVIYYRNSPRDAADWQFGLFTSYEIQQGAWRGFGLGVGVFAVDDRPVVAEEPGKIDGYERVDLHAFYNGYENVNMTFQVRNVNNKTYIESLERTGGLNHFGSPRAYLFNFTYNFD